jgi:hypothetical protein
MEIIKDVRYGYKKFKNKKFDEITVLISRIKDLVNKGLPKTTFQLCRWLDLLFLNFNF